MSTNILRNLKVFYLFNFFTDFVFFAPVAIIIFEKITGSYTLGMSIFSIAYVTAALFEIPTGVVSDMVGRKGTTILGAFFSVLCVLSYAIGTYYWIMVIGAIFQGLSRALYSGNNEALIYDSLKEVHSEKKYEEYLGRLSSMFQLALGLASIIGGIVSSYSFYLVLWISVIPQVVCFVLSLFLIEPSINTNKSTNIYIHLKESLNSLIKNSKLKFLAISNILNFSLGESAFFIRATFINMLWPLWALGIFSMLTHVFGFLSFWFSGKIIKKFSSKYVLNFEVIYGRLANLIALVFPTKVSPLLISSTSLNFGLGIVARNSLMQKEFTQEQRATIASIGSFFSNLAFGIVSIVLGICADNYGIVFTLIIVNILLFVPLPLYRKVFQSR